jgi:hypothetical protein
LETGDWQTEKVEFNENGRRVERARLQILGE